MAERRCQWRGGMSSGIKLLLVVAGGLVVLGLYLGIQIGLFETLQATLDKRIGRVLAGVGG